MRLLSAERMSLISAVLWQGYGLRDISDGARKGSLPLRFVVWSRSGIPQTTVSWYSARAAIFAETMTIAVFH